MARPTETEKLLESLVKEMKKNNRKTDNLEEMAQDSAESDGRRPVKSVKPNLFVTGKRASQADYIAARSAVATEAYTKAYLKEIGGEKKKDKKKKAIDKKEKAEAIKREDKNLEKQLEISNKMLDVLEVGVKEEDKAKLDEIRRHKAGLAQDKKIEEQRIRDKKAEDKRNQGMFANMLDFAKDSVTDSAKEYRNSLEDTFKLGSKERRAFAEQERADAKENLVRVRDMIIGNQQDQMTFQDKQLAKIIEANDMSVEIEGLEKGINGVSVDLVKSANEISEIEMKLQRDFHTKTGKSIEEFRDEQRAEKAKSGRNTFEYRQWIRNNQQAVTASQSYSIQLSEEALELDKETSKKLEKQSKRSLESWKNIKEINEYIAENIKGLKEESDKAHAESQISSKELQKVVIKSGEKTTDAIDDFAKQEKESANLTREIAEEAKDDQKAEFRDNFLKRMKENGLRVAMAATLSDLLDVSKANLKATKDNLLKKVGGGPKGDDGGGFLSSLLGLGALKILLPKLLKIGFVSKILGKLGGFGKLISSFGARMGGMSMGGMLMGSMLGEGMGESLMGADMMSGGNNSGPNKSPRRKKAGMFSRFGGALKSGGSKVMGLLPGAGLAKAGGKSLLKKIPGVGALAGLGFGAQRAMAGDWSGAGMEVLSGLMSTIPGLGTAGSVAMDAALMAKDAGKFGGGGGAKPRAGGKKGGMMGMLKYAIPGLALAGVGSSLFGGDSSAPTPVVGRPAGVFSPSGNSMSGNVSVVGSLEKTITDNTLTREKTQLKILELLEEQNRFMREAQLSDLTQGNIQRGKTKTSTAKANAQAKKPKSLWQKIKDVGSDMVTDAKNWLFGKDTPTKSAGGGGGGSFGGVPKTSSTGTVMKGSGLTPENNATGLNDSNLTNLKAALGKRESSNNYRAVNQYNYLGKYQMGAMALADLGIVKKGTKNSQLDNPSVWNTEGGKEGFLNNHQLQENTMDRLLNLNAKYLGGAKGETQGKIAGMLAASHLLGAGGAKKGPGGSDANGTTWTEYYNLGANATGGDGGTEAVQTGGTISASATTSGFTNAGASTSGATSTPKSPTAMGTGVGSVISNNPVTSMASQANRAIQGAQMTMNKLPNMNSLPFSGLLSQISGGKGKVNSALMKSQQMIGQGMSSISAISKGAEGVFKPPYVSTIADSAMDILKGRSLFDN